MAFAGYLPSLGKFLSFPLIHYLFLLPLSLQGSLTDYFPESFGPPVLTEIFLMPHYFLPRTETSSCALHSLLSVYAESGKAWHLP